MHQGHARRFYHVRNDERASVFYEVVGSEARRFDPKRLPAALVAELPEYGYLFGEEKDPTELPSCPSLEALGQAMTAARPDPGGDSGIPAGYTYVGQFLFHDITWFQSKDRNLISPILDLDSVLGADAQPAPARAGCPFAGPLAVGWTEPGDGVPPVAADIPRVGNLDPLEIVLPGQVPGTPLIAEYRNDDLLPLSQLQLLFIMFTNSVARRQAAEDGGYVEAIVHKQVTQHIQWATLHDYLGRVCDPLVWQDVMANGRRVVHPGPLDKASQLRTSLEFACAAARFGHSMIRDFYGWNANFASVTVESFLAESFRNGPPQRPKMRRLPRDWGVAWEKFFPLRGSVPQMASPIDTRLSQGLAALPERMRTPNAPPDAPPFNLAQQTLQRHRDLGLVSAQKALAAMNALLGAGRQIDPLPPTDIPLNDLSDVENPFRRFPALIERTPIWYYVLREAELCGGDRPLGANKRLGGRRLGAFGSRLLMETIHAAIEASDVSILAEPGWRPSLGVTAGRFTMPDLIAVATQPDPS